MEQPPRRRRPASPSLQVDEVPSHPPSPRKGYCSGLQCTCNSDGEDRPRTPLGGYDSPPRKKPRQGRGYKHYRAPAVNHQSLIASLKRARQPKQRQAILANAPSSFIRHLRNLTRQLASGNVRVSAAQRKRLLPYGNKLIQFAKLNSINQLRRRAVTGGRTQKGGILPIIPFLIGLGPLLAKGLAIGAASAVGSLAVKKVLSNDSVPQTGSGAYGRKRYYYYR